MIDFLLGVIVGCVAGMLIMSLCAISANNDLQDDYENNRDSPNENISNNKHNEEESNE